MYKNKNKRTWRLWRRSLFYPRSGDPFLELQNWKLFSRFLKRCGPSSAFAPIWSYFCKHPHPGRPVTCTKRRYLLAWRTIQNIWSWLIRYIPCMRYFPCGCQFDNFSNNISCSISKMYVLYFVFVFVFLVFFGLAVLQFLQVFVLLMLFLFVCLFN